MPDKISSIENTSFELHIKDGVPAIRSTSQCVAVLCYTVDQKGEIDQVGIVTENNPHFKKGKVSGLVTGKVEDRASQGHQFDPGTPNEVLTSSL